MTANDEKRLALLDALVASIADHIWMVDEQGRYVVANEAFRNIHGLDSKDILGKTSVEVFPSDVAQKYLEADLQMMRDKQPVTREDEMLESATHQIVQIELSKTPLIDANGGY